MEPKEDQTLKDRLANALDETAVAVSEETYLTREDIEADQDKEYGTVLAWKNKQGVPANLRIATVDAESIIDWTEKNEGPEKRTMGLRLVIKSAVDKDGNRLFTDEDLPMIGRKSVKVTERVVRAILSLNGLSVKDREAAKKG